MESGKPLPAWAVRLHQELTASDARAAALVKPLTPEQLNWKPAPEKWSVGQCLEHLAIGNEVYLGPIADALAAAPSGKVDEITPGWFASWFIRTYIEPSAKTRRASAPKLIAPVLSRVDPDILERFLNGNRKMRELVVRAAGHDVNRLRFRNPFIPLIRFTVGSGFELTSKHESRHLLQAERVAALIP
jgi:DinB superfamily